MPSVDQQEAFAFPLAKRQKVVPAHASVEVASGSGTGSRIFSSFRTIGLVSPTTVPFTSIPLGKTTFQITTSVGRSLQTYDLRRGLSLVFLSRPQTPAVITATCAWKDRVFAAWGGAVPGEASGVWVFKRGKKIAELQMPAGSTESVDELMIFGSWIVGCCGRRIEVWKSTGYEHYTTLTPPASGVSAGDRILSGVISNMPTYLNKILAGRVDGAVDIWNLSTGKLLYTVLPAAPNSGAVTAIQATPALSLAAIAYSSGALTIHDIRADQPLLVLRSPTDNAPPVTTISFRTDGLGAGEDGREDGVMATAGYDSGDITLWDLNNGGRTTGILRDAHESAGRGNSAGVTKIEFLAGQPVLVSTGTDNALCTWIFDESPFSPIPRPLHARKGHAAPITTLDFLPAESDGSDSMGKWLISASKDQSLWGFSLRKDSQNTELSQGNLKHKTKKRATFAGGNGSAVVSEELRTPEITCIASSLNRDGGMGAAVSGPAWTNPKSTDAESLNATGWESVVTGHKGDKHARTWLWGKKKAGRWTFPTHDGTEVKSVAISPCGTFALVGSAGGSIDMFNLQSGIHRQSFPTRVSPAQARKLQLILAANKEQGKHEILPGQGKHTGAITGLMVDNLNRTVISCGLDGKVKFWDFLTGKLMHELDWSPLCSINGLRYNRSGDLLAFSCDDLSIRVIDIETKNLVRELWGCVGQINDFCISPDGRWVIAASMDSVVRVWDLPTGHLIDAFKVRSTCTSLALSATGEFLATAHADGVGINIWNNKSLFMHVPNTQIDEESIVEIAGPTASGEGGAAMIEAAFEKGPEKESEEGPMLTTEQLSDDMVTLSLMPKNRWQTLVNLDIVKQRNKPKEPPKVPKQAPFFLTAAKPDNQSTELEALESQTSAAEKSRIAKLQDAGDGDLQNSRFTTLLHSGRASGNYESFIEYLKSLSPAKADLEIRSLDPIMRRDHNEMADFVAALTERLRTRRDFELVNAWMAVFLRVHSDTVGSVTADVEQVPGGKLLVKRLDEWKSEQQRESKRLSEMVGYCRGIVGFLRSSR
ncbi:hypothetical protein KEM55_002591 [Ascosphaera atra]|nr:hypothetical protein KEM55_002591 [Ascosphaera atra]